MKTVPDVRFSQQRLRSSAALLKFLVRWIVVPFDIAQRPGTAESSRLQVFKKDLPPQSSKMRQLISPNVCIRLWNSTLLTQDTRVSFFTTCEDPKSHRERVLPIGHRSCSRLMVWMSTIKRKKVS